MSNSKRSSTPHYELWLSQYTEKATGVHHSQVFLTETKYRKDVVELQQYFEYVQGIPSHITTLFLRDEERD